MRGRKPKAREVQIVEGRDKKNPQRFRNEVPETSNEEPIMPIYFDATAQEAWQTIKAVFTMSGMWSSSYQVPIELYCETYSNYRRSLELVRISGQALRIENDDGTVTIKRNPYSVELHRYKEELIKLSIEFGLTPSSRSRIALQKDMDDKDDFLQLLA